MNIHDKISMVKSVSLDVSGIILGSLIGSILTYFIGTGWTITVAVVLSLVIDFGMNRYLDRLRKIRDAS